MGALGHFLERQGIPTVGISLVCEHTETVRPPRALWVTFELGRPFGLPDDPPFQRRVLKAALDLAGYACSSGSACSSGTVEPSHVLLALGRTPKLARGGLRVSFGRHNTPEQVDGLARAVVDAVKRLRALGNQLSFEWPDSVLQPGMKWKIVSNTTQQCHGGMCMQIHKSRDEQMIS